jgi:DNA invertase Pin-like site-specific DNA recombinase
MDSGIDFEAVDFPQANRLTIHILAAVAENEAQAISLRTRAALAAAKARGTRLGGFRGRAGTCNDLARARAARTAKADRRASDLAATIDAIGNDGATSFGQFAAALNARGITAPRGGEWYAAQVRRVLLRNAPAGKPALNTLASEV